MGLTNALLEADTEFEVKMVKELTTLKGVLDKLPYSISALLRPQILDGTIYQGGFLDTLEIVVNHETSGEEVQDELKGIKDLIKEIMSI